MYRIELAPGEVTVFRTIEELATGVRNGVISPKARIYHGASQKWLPIEFHPHYKAALALLAGRPTEVPVPAPKPAERPSFDKLSFLHPSSHTSGEKAPSRPADDRHEQAPEAPVAPAREEPVDPRAVRPTPSFPIARSPYAPPMPADVPTVSDTLPPPRTSAIHTPATGSPASHTPATHSPATHSPATHSPATHSPATNARSPRDAFMDGADLDAEAGYEPDRYAAARHQPARHQPARHVTARHVTAIEIPSPEVSSPPPSLERVSASPVLDLPKISYPEFTPAERPVSESSSSARPRRRMVHIASALLVLALGGYAATLVLSPAAEGAAPPAPLTAAERPIVPAPGAPTTEAPAPSTVARHPASTPPVAAAPAPATAPRRANPAAGKTADAPLPPASSGFAPALEPRAIVSTPVKTAKPGTPADSVPSVAPAPIEMDVSVPALAGAESLAGAQRRQSDSAIKKILRAVNGGKDAQPHP